MGSKARVVIVDDHRMLREGLRSILESHEDFSVVGEAGDGCTALACVEQTVPDVLLLDIQLPDENGLGIARKALSIHSKLRVVILSANLDGELVNEALRMGVSGFLSKEEASDELVRALQIVVSGKAYLSPAAATSLFGYLQSHLSSLAKKKDYTFSDRELAVLKLVVEGLRNKEIASHLGIGIKSVESYRARLMAKAGCSSPADLVRFALREKLVAA